MRRIIKLLCFELLYIVITQGSDEQVGLDMHNKFRAIHEAPAMKLNSELSAGAKAYAQKLADTRSFEHSSGSYGENLAKACQLPSDKKFSHADATKMWYNEVCKPGYNFETGGFSGGTGHFTQVVWIGSTELGIGSATVEEDGNPCTYVVGRYTKAGNYEGKFKENVKKGSFTPSICDQIDGMVKQVDDMTGSGGSTGNPGPTSDVNSNTENNPSTSPNAAQSPSDANVPISDATVEKISDAIATGAIAGAIAGGRAGGKTAVEVVKKVGGHAKVKRRGMAKKMLVRKGVPKHIRHTMVIDEKDALMVQTQHQKSNEVNKGRGQALRFQPANEGFSRSDTGFAEQSLASHNAFRKIHGTPAMTLDSSLTENCQKWAEHLVSIQKMDHSKLDGYGENLAYACDPGSKEMTAQEAIAMWYGEVCDPGYPFGTENPTTGTLHFSQLVWKESTKLGMAKASGQQGDMHCTYVVARYKVRGNMGDQYNDNVPKGTFTKDTCNKLKEIAGSTTDANTSTDPSAGASTTDASADASTTDASAASSNTDDSTAVSPADAANAADASTATDAATATPTDATTGENSTPSSDSSGSADSASTAAATSGGSFAEQSLAAHNAFRKIHGTPAMTLDSSLTEDCQKWAENLVSIHSMKHSEAADYGENLAYACDPGSKEMTAQEAIVMWYNEACKPGYPFGSANPPGSVLHFSQLVWKKSTKLGMAKASGKKGSQLCTYVVARYKEKGNMGGQYVDNVPKGSFTTDTCNKLKEIVAAATPSDAAATNPSTPTGSATPADSTAGDASTPSSNDANNANADTSNAADSSDDAAKIAKAKEAAAKAGEEAGKKVGEEIGKKLASRRHSVTGMNLQNQLRPGLKGVMLTGISQRRINLFDVTGSRRNSEVKPGERKTSGTDGGVFDSGKKPSLEKAKELGAIAGAEAGAKAGAEAAANLLRNKDQQAQNKPGSAAQGTSDNDASPVDPSKPTEQNQDASTDTGSTPSSDPSPATPSGEATPSAGADTTPAPGEVVSPTPEAGASPSPSSDKAPETPDNGDSSDPSSVAEAAENAAKAGAEAGRVAGEKAAIAAVQILKRSSKRYFFYGSGNPYESSEPYVNGDPYEDTYYGMYPHELAQYNNYHIKENFYPQAEESGSTGDTRSTDLVAKAGQIGAEIGAEKGAVAAAEACVQAAGGTEADKQAASLKAKEIGKKKAKESGGGGTAPKPGDTGNIGGSGNDPTVPAADKPDSGSNDPNAPSTDKPGSGSNDPNAQAADKPASAKPTKFGDGFGPTVDADKFADAGLKAHNIFRKLHGTPPLKLNKGMSQKAEEWAKRLVAEGSLTHSSPEERDKNGENLAYACIGGAGDNEMKAEQAVHNWYAEVCDPGYTFGAAKAASGTLHFTQVIWKESTELGIGKAQGEKDGMKCTYVVGRYKIAGNMGGKYIDNVPKGDFTDAKCSSLQEMIKGIGDAASRSSNTTSQRQVIGLGRGLTADQTKFMDEMLESHNDFREIHNASPLQYDDNMNDQAQKYAEFLAKKGSLEHQKGILDGENLAMKCQGPQERDPKGSFYSTLWYQEVCNPGYNFDNARYQRSAGHFSQLAWKSTKSIGIGRARSLDAGSNCEYVVARYRPPGNVIGEYHNNILKGSYDENICRSVVPEKRYGIPKYFKRKHITGTWVL